MPVYLGIVEISPWRSFTKALTCIFVTDAEDRHNARELFIESALAELSVADSLAYSHVIHHRKTIVCTIVHINKASLNFLRHLLDGYEELAGGEPDDRQLKLL